MDLETLVEVVVEEVRRAMAAREAVTRRLLVVMTGTPCYEAAIKAELSRLRDSGRFRPTLLFSRTAAAHWDRAGLAQALGCSTSLDETGAPAPPELVWQTDLVLVPWLSLNTAAKLALGICDSPITATLMMALLKGLPVVACAEEADPDGESLRSWARPAPALAAMLRERVARLRSFGITLVEHGQLAAALLSSHQAAPAAPASAAAEPAQARPAGRRVVTEAEVRAALAAGDLTTLPADGIFTPLARDLLRAGLHTGR